MPAWPKTPPFHSDRKKFCSALNGAQGRKMSEWALSVHRNSTTSKLNARLVCSRSDFNDLDRNFKP
jgi:hypothetical protein